MMPFLTETWRRGTLQTLAGVPTDLLQIHQWLYVVDCIVEDRLGSVAASVLLDSD